MARRFVGRWLDKLEALDLLDDTLVIVTSDHGEELLERGHAGRTSCNLKGTLYDECLRVPLIMRYPRRLWCVRAAEWKLIVHHDLATRNPAHPRKCHTHAHG